MSDRFTKFTEGLESPAAQLEAITPSDTTDLNTVTRGLNVAQSGFVQVTTKDGDVGTVFVVQGGIFPIRVTRVWATGTTATGIVGLS